MTYRRIVRLALASAAATGLAWAWTGVPSASAEPTNSVLVSLDGQQWSQSLEGLFPAEGFIPGAAYTRTVQVKNDSPVDATLEVAVVGASGTTPEFLDLLILGAQGSSGTVGELPLAAATSCSTLMEEQILPAGATVPVALSLRMADVAGDAGKGASAEFAIAVSLREVGMPTLADECGAAGTNSPDPAQTAVPVGGQNKNAAAAAVPEVAPAAAVEGGAGSTPPRATAGGTAEKFNALGLPDAPPPLAPVLVSAGAAGVAALGVLFAALLRRRHSAGSE